MSPKKNEIEKRRSGGANTLLLGALVGAGAGLLAAILINRRANNKGRDSLLTPTEGIKIGVLVFGLLRAIAALNED